MLVPVGKRSVDVSVAFLERNFDSVANFVGFALPGAQTDGWDFVAGVEGEGFSMLTWDQLGLGAPKCLV